MDLGRLSECSEYFRALSQSRMRETSESLIHLDHVSSSVFYNLLEFSFHHKFKVPQEELGTHIQVCRFQISLFIRVHIRHVMLSFANSAPTYLLLLPPFLTLEVSSYLLAEAFLSTCLLVLADELSPANCLSYLSLAQEICCVELKMTVLAYLSRNLLEMPHFIKYATLNGIIT